MFQKKSSASPSLHGIPAAIDGSENEQIFSHVPQVLAEEVEQEDTMKNEESENDSPDSFVEGDDLDPFRDL